MLTMEQLNELGFEAFIDVMGNVIEHCPVLAAALWRHRPFASDEDLMTKMADIVHQLPFEGIPLLIKQNLNYS